MENINFQAVAVIVAIYFIVIKILGSDSKNINPYLRLVKNIDRKFKVYEMYNKDADFKTLLCSLCSDLIKKYGYQGIQDLDLENEGVRHEVESSLKKNNLVFEFQEQIQKFAQENKQWLRTDNHETFFPFTKKVNNEEKFFVEYIRICSHGLAVRGFQLSDGSTWTANNAHRVVVPCQTSWWLRLRHLFS
ncbi:MAG: hypothetical protein ACI9AR_000626 [Flavobacteriaceae bacterium]|jgi:hypothetical protein